MISSESSTTNTYMYHLSICYWIFDNTKLTSTFIISDIRVKVLTLGMFVHVICKTCCSTTSMTQCVVISCRGIWNFAKTCTTACDVTTHNTTPVVSLLNNIAHQSTHLSHKCTESTQSSVEKSRNFKVSAFNAHTHVEVVVTYVYTSYTSTTK